MSEISEVNVLQNEIGITMYGPSYQSATLDTAELQKLKTAYEKYKYSTYSDWKSNGAIIPIDKSDISKYECAYECDTSKSPGCVGFVYDTNAKMCNLYSSFEGSGDPIFGANTYSSADLPPKPAFIGAFNDYSNVDITTMEKFIDSGLTLAECQKEAENSAYKYYSIRRYAPISDQGGWLGQGWCFGSNDLKEATKLGRSDNYMLDENKNAVGTQNVNAIYNTNIPLQNIPSATVNPFNFIGYFNDYSDQGENDRYSHVYSVFDRRIGAGTCANGFLAAKASNVLFYGVQIYGGTTTGRNLVMGSSDWSKITSMGPNSTCKNKDSNNNSVGCTNVNAVYSVYDVGAILVDDSGKKWPITASMTYRADSAWQEQPNGNVPSANYDLKNHYIVNPKYKLCVYSDVVSPSNPVADAIACCDNQSDTHVKFYMNPARNKPTENVTYSNNTNRMFAGKSCTLHYGGRTITEPRTGTRFNAPNSLGNDSDTVMNLDDDGEEYLQDGDYNPWRKYFHNGKFISRIAPVIMTDGSGNKFGIYNSIYWYGDAGLPNDHDHHYLIQPGYSLEVFQHYRYGGCSRRWYNYGEFKQGLGVDNHSTTRERGSWMDGVDQWKGCDVIGIGSSCKLYDTATGQEITDNGSFPPPTPPPPPPPPLDYDWSTKLRYWWHW